MKNYLSFLVVLLLLFSCQSNNKIIKKYLEDEISNDTIKNNVIIKKQITFSETLRTFQGMKVSFNSDELKTYNDLKTKYQNDKEEIWTHKKFNLSNIIIIIDEDSINNFIQTRRNKLQNKYFADKFNMYFISKPYFYNNNKNVFFRIKKTRVFNNLVFDEVIVMERKKGKWIVFEKKVNSDL